MTDLGLRKNTHRLERVDAEKLSHSLPALMLQAEKLVNGFDPGTHGRRKSGVGEDFWQFKSYEHSDPSSSIDWRQSAKRDQLFIRQNELETPESVWFWCDNSPGMAFSSKNPIPSKLFQSRVLTLATALLLMKGSENFAYIGGLQKASQGPVSFERFTENLLRLDSKDLATLTSGLRLPKKARVVLISDFLYPQEQLQKFFNILQQTENRGLLVQINDPAEIGFPFKGRILFKGMNGPLSALFGRSENIRDEYLEKFQAHQTFLKQAARKLQWDYLGHNTEKPMSEPLSSIFFSLQRKTK
ncbi:DUF58 domain-containing protein [Sneathiella aquimaris]|uniref:DUF58 domain-containing protein n=1 Tax=Sneathiella aquimaris TaxID=2599305 RepID=UPI00146BDC6F|nr:DUF58 domain-containing protein [Sneathiella aquimaris]